MSFNLRARSLLTVHDCTPGEFRHLLDLARDLKRARYARTEQRRLLGKTICLICDRPSDGIRCAFEVACHDQGAHVTSIDPAGWRIARLESCRDAARVLGRMYDAIEYGGASRTGIETFATHAGVPVFSGLTAPCHPTQLLADVMTMREHSDRPIAEIRYAFVGDTHSYMGCSLMIIGCLLGMDVRVCGPQQLWPSDDHIRIARRLQCQSGARLTITDDAGEAVRGVDFIHTASWMSMGEPRDVREERLELLRPYQVNMRLMKASGNPQIRFMHCLPAFHDAETAVGRQIAETAALTNGIEVTDDVFESEYNIAFEQAENRMHTIKAFLVATLGD